MARPELHDRGFDSWVRSGESNRPETTRLPIFIAKPREFGFDVAAGPSCCGPVEIFFGISVPFVPSPVSIKR